MWGMQKRWYPGLRATTQSATFSMKNKPASEWTPKTLLQYPVESSIRRYVKPIWSKAFEKLLILKDEGKNPILSSISMHQRVVSFSHLSLCHVEVRGAFPEFNLAYTTYGTWTQIDPCIWVIHALTGDQLLARSGGVESLREGKFCLDPSFLFYICANLIGWCYGSTIPFS